jgi:hypothetical protein
VSRPRDSRHNSRAGHPFSPPRTERAAGTDHVATLKWLFDGKDFPNPYQYQYVLAQLEEAAGQRESAIAAYKATLQALGSRGETAGPIASGSRAALVRLARR